MHREGLDLRSVRDGVDALRDAPADGHGLEHRLFPLRDRLPAGECDVVAPDAAAGGDERDAPGVGAARARLQGEPRAVRGARGGVDASAVRAEGELDERANQRRHLHAVVADAEEALALRSERGHGERARGRTKGETRERRAPSADRSGSGEEGGRAWETRADERTPLRRVPAARGARRATADALALKISSPRAGENVETRRRARRGGDEVPPALPSALEDKSRHVQMNDSSNAALVEPPLLSPRFPLLPPYSLSPVSSTT